MLAKTYLIDVLPAALGVRDSPFRSHRQKNQPPLFWPAEGGPRGQEALSGLVSYFPSSD